MRVAPKLDPVVHAPARLQLVALLVGVTEMEFSTARETLGVSDSVLSKHLSQLTEAGYVLLRKANLGGRQRTWLAITPAGRTAFQAHVTALEELAGIARASR